MNNERLDQASHCSQERSRAGRKSVCAYSAQRLVRQTLQDVDCCGIKRTSGRAPRTRGYLRSMAVQVWHGGHVSLSPLFGTELDMTVSRFDAEPERPKGIGRLRRACSRAAPKAATHLASGDADTSANACAASSPDRSRADRSAPSPYHKWNFWRSRWS